jgi:hypothetical protein
LRLCIFLFSGILFAQTTAYFPLEPGNVWMYRAAASAQPETTFRTISVDGVETLNGLEYFRVHYFGRTVYLRPNEEEDIVSLNRQTNAEEPWLALTGEEGSTFETHIDQCATTGRIESQSTEVVTPAGEFFDAVQVSYQGTCADAGTTKEYYAYGTGLAAHEETTLAGPRLYELVYFRSGSTNVTGSEVSFTIALDSARYVSGSTMNVRLTLRNTHTDPLLLHFPSGQSFDLKIFDAAGNTVYVWSADKMFPAVIRDEQIGPGERTYGFAVPLGALAPGRYKAQGYLTTAPVMYLGETSFEIIAPAP